MLQRFNSKYVVPALAGLLFVVSVHPVFGHFHTGMKPAGFVSDLAHVMSSADVAALESKLSAFAKSTGIEVAVVTLPELAGETIETYAVQLFEDWGIGSEKDDKGVLFLIAPTEKEVRIEVGYGLEGVLTDAQSAGILSSIVIPEFQKGAVPVGIVKGTDAILAVVQSEASYSQPKVSSNILESLAQFGFIFFMVILGILARTKSWWLGGVIGAGIGVIVAVIAGFLYIGLLSIIGLTLLGLLIDFIVSKSHGRGGHGGFWGGFGGGSMGGGFGGFGGGMSGGGGASGRW